IGETHRLLHPRILEREGRFEPPRNASAVALEQREHLVDAVHRAAEQHAPAVGAERGDRTYVGIRPAAFAALASVDPARFDGGSVAPRGVARRELDEPALDADEHPIVPARRRDDRIDASIAELLVLRIA